MNQTRYKNAPRRTALALAMAVGLSVSGFAFAQATTGTIFGNAPAESGETVTVTSASGVVRTATVNDQGRYTLADLPVGTYTVTLKRDGTQVDQHKNVTVRVGAGNQVNFANQGAQNAQQLGAVEVSANQRPSIDVTSVSSSTVIDAQQLRQLPVGRNAESIALLAPGTVSGSNAFQGNAVSFGGAGVTENAYYVNGYNTTEPYRNTGGFQLPYGSIEQQQTYTGGYSAKYGRSDGGVINQVGKRGTNEWHFGGQISWEPRALSAGGKNIYYPTHNLPDGYQINNPDQPGTLYRDRGHNKSWETVYSAYVGGPLVKDKLFAFFSVETTKDKYRSVGADVPVVTDSYFTRHETRSYGKIDWNIDENNILELTSLINKNNGSVGGVGSAAGKGATYHYDYGTGSDGAFMHPTDSQLNNAKFLIAKYTSYIGDNATLNVTWGRGKFKNNWEYGASSDLPYIYTPTNQNPADLPAGVPGIANNQPRLYDYLPDASNHTHGLRVDFTYRLGAHKLGVGIDNMYYSAHDQGQMMSGPGYMWMYGHGKPDEAINDGLGVGAPGGDGYYVDQYVYDVATSMSMKQKAWYIQDVWDVTDRFQLNLGLRNDHFINNNDKGIAFVDEKNQWEPRLGFSWDVNGDSSLKIYGNAGRYYLALPDNVAERAANTSTFTDQYFTYTSIDDNGIPHGLTPINDEPVSANHELGQPKDPHTVTATDLKAQYQDEYILGFDKTLGDKWVYGAKATYRKLQTAIDDVCDVGRLKDKLSAMGLNADDYDWDNPGCRIFNPGETNTFAVARKDGSGYANVRMSTSDWGFDQGASRKYYALDLYLGHPFDGKWMARVDYEFSRSWGNTEGQVRSDLGQTDVSKTEDWDSWQLMQYSSGYLANHRRHQLKARGAYQITPEWLVSGTLRIQSGSPDSCLGYYGKDDSDPIGYGSNYHWCAGKPMPPGSNGFTPWTHRVDLGVRYTPNFADHKLAFKLDVFNALNEQKTLQTDPVYEVGKGTVSNTYGMGQYFEQPRYVRLSVSYDY